MRNQAVPGGRQAIFDPRRHFGIYFALHQPVGLQRAESHRQHTLRNVLNGFMNIVEPHRAVGMKGDKHQHRPLVAKPAQHVPDGTTTCGMKVFHFLIFSILLTLSNGYTGVSSLQRSAFLFILPRKHTFACTKVINLRKRTIVSLNNLRLWQRK